MTAQAEHLRDFLLDQIVDNDLGTIERIARRHRNLSYRFDFVGAETAQARGTLFLIILYVNLYCGIYSGPAAWRRCSIGRAAC